MKKRRNMLSVIMPAYNEENCIYQNLLTTSRSIRQFHPDYEIIVVNDGSSDHTLEEALRARDEDSHIKEHPVNISLFWMPIWIWTRNTLMLF